MTKTKRKFDNKKIQKKIEYFGRKSNYAVKFNYYFGCFDI